MRPPPATRLLLVVLAAAFPGCAAHRPGAHAEAELGLRAADKGLWREAALRFERASDARPQDAALWNDLGVAYESLGRLQDAARAYDRALEQAPKDDRIRENVEHFRGRHGSATGGVPTPTPTPGVP